MSVSLPSLLQLYGLCEYSRGVAVAAAAAWGRCLFDSESYADWAEAEADSVGRRLQETMQTLLK